MFGEPDGKFQYLFNKDGSPKKKIVGDLGRALGKSAKVIEEERINDELIEEISQEFPDFNYSTVYKSFEIGVDKKKQGNKELQLIRKAQNLLIIFLMKMD